MAERFVFKQRAYSPEDVAALWSCSSDHVRKLVRTGELPSFRLGGKLIRIRHEDVEAFERERRTGWLEESAPKMPNSTKL